MRKCTLVLIILAISTFLLADARFGVSTNRPAFAPDLIKVKLTAAAESRSNLPSGLYAESPDFGINELDQLMSVNGGQKVIRAHRQVKDTDWAEKTGWDRWFLIKLDGRASVEQAISSFKANRYIETAIPEYYAYTTAVPNDTYYAYNWGHNNTAQLPVYQSGSHSGPGVGTIGFDSDAQLAWDQAQGYGSASIIIAIIDTGVDTSHPDLRLVTGYDYGDNDSNPMDNSADPGHGTACSGVSAGIANNALGVTGIAGGCSVMPLKIASSDGSLGFVAIENALTHCGDYNVDVASMSFGAEGGMGEGDSSSTDAALEYAYSHGVVLLAATANSNASTIAYPSNHNKVISVGASSPTGQRKSTTSSDGETWWGSNYGIATQDHRDAVDIMAPTILPATDLVSGGYSSTNYYMWFNGTSCATPYAAGCAALLLSKNPALTQAQVRTALTSTAIDMTYDGGAGWDRYTGYGLVNVNSALNSLVPGLPICQITAPAAGSVIDLNTTVTINATATDSDGTITGVAFYIDNVLQSTDNSSPYSWNWNTTGYSGGAHEIKAIATDNASNTATSTISITLLAPPDEGFESGNFTLYPWTQSGNLPWVVQSADKYSGTYAAKSGAIDHSQTSTMSVTLSITSSGNISFYQKVSSEANYDYLRFYIDDVQQGSWSGAGTWTAQSYAVNAGTRNFKWTYSKDTSVISGSDCAYVDHIIFPPTGEPPVHNPPQNLNAIGGNSVVYLTWEAPTSGTPTGYAIYRNGAYLTTATGLSYNDGAVVNGTTYSYYLIAVYSTGESVPTPTVQATPLAPYSTITWNPLSFSQDLLPDTSASQYLTIGNTGNAVLNYTLAKPAASQTVLNETFNTSSIPSGWTQENVTGTANWTYRAGSPAGTPSNAYDGSYNASLYRGNNPSYTTRLVSPVMNLSAFSAATLTFYHTQAAYSNRHDQLNVYYRTTSGGALNPLATYTTTIANWTLETLTLPNLSSSYYIVFEGVTNRGGGICVDLIQVQAQGVSNVGWYSINSGNSSSGSVNGGGLDQDNVTIGFNSAGLSVGTYTSTMYLTSNSSTNPSLEIPVTLNVTDQLHARIKAFLQGPYVTGGSMNHALTSVLPLVSPYNANHSVAVLPNVSPRYIVDWVYVQLRATSTGANAQSQSAFLLNDGTIAGLDGSTTLAFTYTGQTSYYVIVQHRNHLGIMSAAAHDFAVVPASAPLIDLSAPDSVWGGNSTGVTLIEPGILAMYSGDADHDESVSPSDLNLYWRIQTGLSGYRSADFNLDSAVAPTDLNLCWRLNTGLQSQIPTGAKGSDSGSSRPFDTRQ